MPYVAKPKPCYMDQFEFYKVIDGRKVYRGNGRLYSWDVHEMTNAQLKRLINKIEVDKDGNVDIYLHLIGDLGLDETVLIEGDKNTEEKGTKKVPNSYNHT